MHCLVWAGLVSVLLVDPGINPGHLVVSESAFLSAVDASHPALAEATAALALARANVLAARTLDNPTLGVVREDLSGPNEQIDWSVSWQLPQVGRRSRVAAREEDVAAAKALRAQAERSLRASMRQDFAEWSLAAARLERLSVYADRVQRLAEREHLRVAQGEAAGLDAQRLDLATGVLRARVAQAAAAVEQARTKAAIWSPGLPRHARPLLPKRPSAPNLGDRHPLVDAAHRKLAAARLDREAVARFVRTPEVQVGWQHARSGEASADGPTMGVRWSVPLLGRNRAEKSASEAEIPRAQKRIEQVQREVARSRAGTAASFERLTNALTEAEASQNLHERMLTSIEAAFGHGEATVTDLLDIHRSVTESELAVLDLYEAVLALHRDLEQLAGDTENPPTDQPPAHLSEVHLQEEHP